MSRLYRPSNGAEGECFMSQWCAICERERALREDDMADGCDILARTFALRVDHPDYPEEWCHSDDGRPVCTAFVFDGEAIPVALDPAAVVRPLL
jgi:hypothetical protein